MEREKKVKNDVEKTKRKIEGDLKLTQEAVGDLERAKTELNQTVARKENTKLLLHKLRTKVPLEISIISKLKNCRQDLKKLMKNCKLKEATELKQKRVALY